MSRGMKWLIGIGVFLGVFLGVMLFSMLWWFGSTVMWPSFVQANEQRIANEQAEQIAKLRYNLALAGVQMEGFTAAAQADIAATEEAVAAQADIAATEEAAAALADNVCPTTEYVQLITGVHVVHVDTEPCSFTWRGYPVATILAICPDGFVCTFHVWNDDIVVHEGIGQSAQISAGTWRMMGFYPAEDVCDVYNGEADFGDREVNPFKVRFQPVEGGVQDCPGAWMGEEEVAPADIVVEPTAVPDGTPLICPKFGNVDTKIGDDGSPYCKLDNGVNPVTDLVPDGFIAEYWDGSAVQIASAGASITTATATFRPQ